MPPSGHLVVVPVTMSSRLHIPSLFVEGFRGIRSLDLPRLGRVTLIAGENGVGKTTVLDACRLYASRGDVRVIADLLDAREEFVVGVDDDGDPMMFPDFSSLFHDSDDVHEPGPVRIRSKSPAYNLSVRLTEPDEDDRIPAVFFEGEEPRVFKVFVGERSRIVRAGALAYYDRFGRRMSLRGAPRIRQAVQSSDPWPSSIQNESLGPGFLHNDDFIRLWHSVALTESEALVVKALRLVVGEDIERLAVIGEDTRTYRTRGPRAIAKLRSSRLPVPLKRLGDGANRLFAVALALANSRDGLLLIDEAENGIHYSVQTDLWRMIFSAAEAANIQVIAATHSWDCIAGFAAAAVQSTAEGTMFRIERSDSGLEGIFYSEENLEVIAQQRIEVR